MIRFKNVTKDFGGELPALDDISFEVADGEFIFLTGHSGSGKSTLLKIITKEYLPTSGDVDFNDVPLSKIKGGKVHKHRRQIGVVFQDYRLLPELNIWENIALPLEIMGRKNAEIEERVTDLLELVQLTDKAHVFPSQLSGGESQRVGVARALATAPMVLLADEPTGNLDPQNTLLIAKLFHKINELGTTIIFATHDQDILQSLPHRRLNLIKGKISEDTGSKAPKKTEKPAPPEKKVTEEKPHEKAPEKSPDKPDKKQEAAPEKKEKVTAKVENLDETPVPEIQDEALTTKPSKKKAFPKLHFGNPFSRKKKANDSSASTADSPDDSVEDVKPPDEEELKKVLIQVESLEEDK